MFVRPCNARTEMYASHFACCPLVSHVKYAPRPQALLRLEKDALLTLEKDGTDRRTDGQTVTFRFPRDAANVAK